MDQFALRASITELEPEIAIPCQASDRVPERQIGFEIGCIRAKRRRVTFPSDLPADVSNHLEGGSGKASRLVAPGDRRQLSDSEGDCKCRVKACVRVEKESLAGVAQIGKWRHDSRLVCKPWVMSETRRPRRRAARPVRPLLDS